MEVWKKIAGEEYYEVSNFGRVRSKERVVNFGKQKRVVKEKILTPKDNGRGYKTVRIGNRYPYIHRLVAQAFINNPNNLPEIDHINTIKDDNRVENLRWVNRKMNMNNSTTLNKHIRKTDEEKKETRRLYLKREDVKLRISEIRKQKRKDNPEKYRELDRLRYLRRKKAS